MITHSTEEDQETTTTIEEDKGKTLSTEEELKMTPSTEEDQAITPATNNFPATPTSVLKAQCVVLGLKICKENLCLEPLPQWVTLNLVVANNKEEGT